MAVVSVVGTSGVGKSFLVKQLASYYCAPAFFEGEEGTIPKKILQNVFSAKTPYDRWKFFVARYVKNLSKAKIISQNCIHCFVDGSPLSTSAIMVYEEKKYHVKLEKIRSPLNKLWPDKTILLIASDAYLKKTIALRNRSTEQNKEAINRAIHIQNEYIVLAKKEKSVIIIDRTKLDFGSEEDMMKIVKKLRL